MYRRLAGLLLLSTLLFVPGSTSSAQSTHQALVVIDTGSTVKHVCIRFTSNSISGRDALDLAARVDPSVAPVYRDYGGDYGVAVCSLCGVGTSSGDCPGSAGNYWAYYRAAAGSAQFVYASTGASNTTVHDGDVEGWHWRPGAPPYASVQQVCGTISSTGSFTPDSPPSSGPGPSASPPAAGSQSTATSRAVIPPPVKGATREASTVVVPDASTTAVSPVDATTLTAGARAEAAPRLAAGRRTSGGSVAGLAGFAAALGLLLGGAWLLRRRRRS
jgi:hypothetical protein